MADTVIRCVHEVGSLLVAVADTTGVVGNTLLKSLEAFVSSLTSTPDGEEIGR